MVQPGAGEIQMLKCFFALLCAAAVAGCVTKLNLVIVAERLQGE
jgi:hypothetical protein